MRPEPRTSTTSQKTRLFAKLLGMKAKRPRPFPTRSCPNPVGRVQNDGAQHREVVAA